MPFNPHNQEKFVPMEKRVTTLEVSMFYIAENFNGLRTDLKPVFDFVARSKGALVALIFSASAFGGIVAEVTRHILDK